MIKRNVIESPAKMPAEGGVRGDYGAPANMLGPTPPGANPLTVHSILTPADSRAISQSQYPRNDWLDVKHARNAGGDS